MKEIKLEVAVCSWCLRMPRMDRVSALKSTAGGRERMNGRCTPRVLYHQSISLGLGVEV